MNECKYQHTGRLGLYVMVIIILIVSCEVRDRTARMENQITELSKQITTMKGEGK